ncbi:MAG: hypothetical protein A2284_03200 [Deltaproteobacteria bacterium RIFOXYA12_FULL_61_11]|nr:MAG: hypothetical protein A2284_03200 [Deltaproteobacteria bacterium RIFOXYA12_FULL_61_11]
MSTTPAITSLQNSTVLNKQAQTVEEVNPADMGREEFLTLLVKQLEYQDPMNPMDNAEFTQQLAQFSSLEQLFNINKTLDSMHAEDSAGKDMLDAGYVGYLGKVAKAYSSEVQFSGGTQMEVTFELPENTKSLSVALIDRSGKVVKTVPIDEPRLAGTNSVAVDTRGLNVGAYRLAVTGQGFAGDEVEGKIYQEGMVSGVSMKDGRPMLTIDGMEVPAATVTALREAGPVAGIQ